MATASLPKSSDFYTIIDKQLGRQGYHRMEKTIFNVKTRLNMKTPVERPWIVSCSIAPETSYFFAHVLSRSVINFEWLRQDQSRKVLWMVLKKNNHVLMLQRHHHADFTALAYSIPTV